MYYLQSRYYDPELGRFISADSLEYLDPETLGGLNLYAYCENNPVMGVDPEGTWNWGHFWKILAAVAIVVAVTALTVVTAGAAAAALGVSATAVMATTAVCGVIGGVGEIIGQCVNNGIDNLNLADVAIETFTNAVYGAASAFGAGPVSWGFKAVSAAVKVGVAGLNTFMHGVNHLGEEGYSWSEIGSQTAKSIGISAAFQIIGLTVNIMHNGALNTGPLDNGSIDNLWHWSKMLIPAAITTGKSIYRHNSEIINKIGMTLGKIILWSWLKRYSKLLPKRFIA